jgi:hypothetical protein
MIKPPGDYRSMSADEILDGLYLQLYEPSFWKLRGVDSDIPVTIHTDSGIFGFVGPPTFDPGDPAVNPLLKSIASRLDGFLWDNVNGTVWWDP